ncbi:MAG TPA: Uma2 family endonuclease [Polyangia bacterium]|nr:Uma2 family endonuclease [Polyangia bacterium]
MNGELRNFSRLDYDNMIRAGILGEDERVELIGGRIVTMSPEGPVHAAAIDLSAEILRRLFGGSNFTVRVQHPLAVGFEDEPEPDIAVVRGGPRDHLTEHPHAAVLVVEVAESSLAYDRGEKSSLYARAGFPDYWIINLVDHRIEVHRDPSPNGYRSIVVLADGEEIAPLAARGARIAVTDLLP